MIRGHRGQIRAAGVRAEAAEAFVCIRLMDGV